jgi:hypothetical protein
MAEVNSSIFENKLDIGIRYFTIVVKVIDVLKMVDKIGKEDLDVSLNKFGSW